MLRRVEPAAAEIKSDPSRHLANEIPLGLHGIESLGEDRLIRPADGGAACSDEIHDGGACEFDLPSYFAWQNRTADARQRPFARSAWGRRAIVAHRLRRRRDAARREAARAVS
jgi:hypothetical protein